MSVYGAIVGAASAKQRLSVVVDRAHPVEGAVKRPDAAQHVAQRVGAQRDVGVALLPASIQQPLALAHPAGQPEAIAARLHLRQRDALRAADEQLGELAGEVAHAVLGMLAQPTCDPPRAEIVLARTAAKRGERRALKLLEAPGAERQEPQLRPRVTGRLAAQ